MANPIHLTLTFDIEEDGDELLARCRELDIVTSAGSLDELRDTVDELVAGYFQACSVRGTLSAVLEQLARDGRVAPAAAADGRADPLRAPLSYEPHFRFRQRDVHV
jgi:hypothetical protein